MNRLQGIPDFFASLAHPNPERDWFFTLAFLLLPAACFALYAAYTFFGLQSGFIVSSSPAPFPAQTITEEEIQSVLNSYRARKARYDAGSQTAVPSTNGATTAPGAGE